MDEVEQSKGITQLLMSPLFLFRQVLGIVVPGALLLLLLAHKGNRVVRNAWLHSPFGYGTKIAISLVFAYIAGEVVTLPFSFILACKALIQRTAAVLRTPKAIQPLPSNPLGSNSDAPRNLLRGAVTDGVILSTPGLADRLSLVQSQAAFYVGTGCALLIAAIFPGDDLGWLEAIIGFAMVFVGTHKAIEFRETYVQHIGIGLASQFGKMTPQQISQWAAFIKTLQTTGVSQSPPEPPKDPKGG
jgi:hypothetical protein